MALILLPVVALLLYGLYAYFFYTCCALPPKFAPVISGGQSSDSMLNDPNLLYAKKALIGLCRTKSGSGGSCHFNTYLYKSGTLVLESGELVVREEGGEKATTYPTVQMELDKNAMDGIINQIRDSGILTKPCEAEMIMDYYVDYFVNLDGIKRETQFPGCEAEFNEIDKLIDMATDA